MSWTVGTTKINSVLLNVVRNVHIKSSQINRRTDLAGVDVFQKIAIYL